MSLVTLVEWAEGYNRRGRYSPIGLTFHWLMAAMMLFQLGHGWWLDRLPVGGDKHLGYQTHAEIGLTLMLLGSLRFFWRSQVGGPTTVDEDSFAGRGSRLVQNFFYVAFFALPLSGWVMWSTLPGDLPLSIAGVVPVPHLPFDRLSDALQHSLLQWAARLHVWIVWMTALAIPAHAGAAVLHHLLARDRVLSSMFDLNGPQQPGVAGSRQGDGPAARSPRP